MQVGRRQWALAFSAAFMVHGLVTVAMLWQSPESGARSVGTGGIEVSLGPAGGTPGAEAQSVDGIAEAKPVTPATKQAASIEPPEIRTTPAQTERAQTVTPAEAVPAEAVTARAAPAETLPSAAIPAPPDALSVEADTEALPVRVETVALAEVVVVDVAPLPDALPVQTTTAVPLESRPVEPETTRAEAVPTEEAAPVEMPETTRTETAPENPRAETSIDTAQSRPPEDAVVARTPDAPQPEQSPETPATTPEPAAEAVPEAVENNAPAAPDQALQTAAATPSSAGAGGEAGSRAQPQAGSGNASSGGGLPGATADYMAVLQAWLERHKKYPRRARLRRQEGMALLYFVMDRDGRVLEHRLQQSSGHDLLDREVVEMIQRAEPLPTMPDDMHQARLELVVPVQFFLR